MKDVCRYLSWKKGAVIVIIGILEIVTQTCATLTRSSPAGFVQHSTSTIHYPAAITTSPAGSTGPYTNPHTTGFNAMSLTPSFSDTYSIQTFAISVTQSPWTTSGLASSHDTVHSNSLTSTLFSKEHSTFVFSLNSQLVTLLNDISTNKLFLGYTSSKISSSNDITFSSNAISLPIPAQHSFTASRISPSRSSMFFGNLATHHSVKSSFYPSILLHSNVSFQNVSNTSMETASLPTSSLHASFKTIATYLSSVQQTTIYATNFSTNSPSVLKYSPAVLLYTTVSPSQSLSSITAKNTPLTPKHSMVIKPPPLRTVTAPTITSVPQHCKTGSCCTYGLSQLPPDLKFEESRPRGFVLAEIRDIVNVNFTVRLAKPLQLIPLLKDSFNITTYKNSYKLVLGQEIDLEELYDQTNGKVDVHSLQLQIACSENFSIIVPPRLLNITVEDVDDSMPVFSNSGTSPDDCVVPVYRADTSEDYMGELSLRPGKIEAVDGDVSTRHNISYKVLHSEPADYHVYFSLDTENGTVHKTKSMNSSDPSKYVIFVQAVEDSPQQKSRVAVLSIVVVAPSDPFTNPNQVNPTARLALQIACAFILMGFICGIVVVVHRRYTVARTKDTSGQKDEERDVKLPKLAVYQSSSSSLNSAIPEVPTISSPSQVVVASDYTLKPECWLSESQKTRRLIVKRPLDTNLRPGWNAPAPKPKRNRYNPFSVYQKTRAS